VGIGDGVWVTGIEILVVDSSEVLIDDMADRVGCIVVDVSALKIFLRGFAMV